MEGIILPLLFLGYEKLKVVDYGDSQRVYVKLDKRKKVSKEVIRDALEFLNKTLKKRNKYLEINKKVVDEVMKKCPETGAYKNLGKSDRNGFDFFIQVCTGEKKKESDKIGSRITHSGKVKVEGEIKHTGEIKHKIVVPETTVVIHQYKPETTTVIHEIKLKRGLEEKIDSLINKRINIIFQQPIVLIPHKIKGYEKGFFRLDKDKSIDRSDFGFGFGHRNTDGIDLWLAPIVAINLHTVNKAKEGKPRVAAKLEWTLLNRDDKSKNLLNVGADIYNPWLSGGFFVTLDSTDVATVYGKAGGALDLNPVVVSGAFAGGIDSNMKIKHLSLGALDYNSKMFGIELYGRSGENKYGIYTNLGGAKMRIGNPVRMILGVNYETLKGMEFFNNNEPIGDVGYGEIGFMSGIQWIFDNRTGLYLMGELKAAKEQDREAKIVDKSATLGITYHFR